MFETIMGFGLWLGVGILFAYLCAGEARKQRRDPSGWAVFGFLFGIVPLMVLHFLLDPLPDPLPNKYAFGKSTSCPKCHSLELEEVGETAFRCSKCGHVGVHGES